MFPELELIVIRFPFDPEEDVLLPPQLPKQRANACLQCIIIVFVFVVQQEHFECSKCLNYVPVGASLKTFFFSIFEEAKQYKSLLIE